MSDQRRRRGGRGRDLGDATSQTQRSWNYRQLKHPFQPQRIFSEDAIADIHATALRVLRELGMKILFDEARQIFAAAGAIVDDDTQMVRIGEDIVEQALQSAPPTFRMRAANPQRDLQMEPGSMIFYPGSGCPNVTDLERGRRPGSLESYEETLKLQQSFDVIHMHGPSAEPQDVPAEFRHYDMMRGQLEFGDKPMFVYARGRQQAEECFQLIQQGLNLSADDFASDVWSLTVINTNSPRQLDVPMAQALIDFARAGQLSIITPFCLAGAMAPVSIAGALVLQHAEALASIALAQLARPGAPVLYGGFSSNVDMKSGSPAFGTPEHIKFAIGTGQLARHIGLPWRGASGAASNTPDMQAGLETNMGLWGALQANATVTIHSAGWLEGGLCFGYEKFINDVEALQMVAELCAETPSDADSLGWSALEDVQPGGHFFATAHTMERYKDAFYQPLVADLSNFGAWTDAGELTSTQRATQIWKDALDRYQQPDHGPSAGAAIAKTIADWRQQGGAPPVGG